MFLFRSSSLEIILSSGWILVVYKNNVNIFSNYSRLLNSFMSNITVELYKNLLACCRNNIYMQQNTLHKNLIFVPLTFTYNSTHCQLQNQRQLLLNWIWLFQNLGYSVGEAASVIVYVTCYSSDRFSPAIDLCSSPHNAGLSSPKFRKEQVFLLEDYFLYNINFIAHEWDFYSDILVLYKLYSHEGVATIVIQYFRASGYVQLAVWIDLMVLATKIRKMKRFQVNSHIVL